MRDFANRKGARGLMISASCFVLAISSGARAALAGPPQLPSGASVVAGSASIQQSGPASTLIVQKTRNAVINWQNFSVGAGAGVTFQQPDSASITLNRVTGPDASAVDGSLLQWPGVDDQPQRHSVRSGQPHRCWRADRHHI